MNFSPENEPTCDTSSQPNNHLPDFAFIVEGDVDAVSIYDSEWRFVYVNASTERMTGLHRTELLGRSVHEIWPSAFDAPGFLPLRKAMAERTTVISQLPSASRAGEWREARAVPIAVSSGDGLLIYWRDVTVNQQLESARRQADAYALAATSALDAVSDAFTTLDSDFKIIFANAEAGRINLKPVSEFIGRSFWEEWPTLVGSEVETICRRIMHSRERESFIRHWYVPGLRDVWLECSAYPDELSGGIHLVYRDITKQHNHERRERFLAASSERSQSLTDPDEVVLEAVRGLGEFLEVHRCCFADVDLVADTSTILTDYCAPGVDSIAGVYPLSDYGDYLISEFKAGRPVAVNDIYSDTLRVPPDTIAAYEALGAIAHVTVPLVHNARLVSAIAVHSTTPRVWTEYEIELLQEVVEKTWLTIEVVRQNRELFRLQERDHNIAEQLQRALIPKLPTELSGLEIRSYYRASLQEAEVGGDFADCFPFGDGFRTFVAVGDVSGKGLRAASQVASIRNMLRFALHTHDRIDDAVLQLNRVLVRQEQVEGFATLFVGQFDSRSNILTYVNCGQDPGLIWKTEKRELLFLEPTGPVLNTFDDNDYSLATVQLDPGDIFALFTDGLTEAGPSRRQLLGIDGIADYFVSAVEGTLEKNARYPSEIAQSVLKTLIDSIENYAGGESALRDDIAVIVGVVGDSTGSHQHPSTHVISAAFEPGS